MEICNECVARIQEAFPRKSLVSPMQIPFSGKCNVCNKRRACKMYELTDKEVDGDVGETTKL